MIYLRAHMHVGCTLKKNQGQSTCGALAGAQLLDSVQCSRLQPCRDIAAKAAMRAKERSARTCRPDDSVPHNCKLPSNETACASMERGAQHGHGRPECLLHGTRITSMTSNILPLHCCDACSVCPAADAAGSSAAMSKQQFP